jgi:peptidoglycan/LPS O-acetylase OafA/YrhL
VLHRWQAAVEPAVLVIVVTAAMIVIAWLVHRYVEQPLAPLMKRTLQRAPTLLRSRSIHYGLSAEGRRHA